VRITYLFPQVCDEFDNSANRSPRYFNGAGDKYKCFYQEFDSDTGFARPEAYALTMVELVEVREAARPEEIASAH
jgi:hypothetical protein